MLVRHTCKPKTASVEKLAAFANKTGLAFWVVEPGGGKFVHVNSHAKAMYPYHDFNSSEFASWQRSGVEKGRISNLIAYLDTELYIHQVKDIFNRSPLIEFTVGHADTGAKCHVIHAQCPDGSWIQLRSMDGEVPPFDGEHLDEILGSQSLTPRSVERMIRRANYECPLTVEESLNLVQVPTAICTYSGLVIFANESMIRLCEQGDGLRLAGGRLVAQNDCVSADVSRMIADHAVLDGSQTPSLLRIPRKRGLPLVASIEPAMRHVTAIKGVEPMSLVSVADPDQRPEIHPEWLQSLYGLSIAEAEVAVLVASGLSAKEVARARNVSPGTVNNQLSAAYAKTGASSGAKLQQIISNLAQLRLANRPWSRSNFN